MKTAPPAAMLLLALFNTEQAHACSGSVDDVYYAFPEDETNDLQTTVQPFLVASSEPEVELFDAAGNAVALRVVETSNAQLDGLSADTYEGFFWFPLYRLVPDSLLAANAEHTLRYRLRSSYAGHKFRESGVDPNAPDAGASDWREVSFRTASNAESQEPARPKREDLTIEAVVVPDASSESCETPLQVSFGDFAKPSWFEACVSFAELDLSKEELEWSLKATKCTVFNRPFAFYAGGTGWVEQVKVRRLSPNGTLSAPLVLDRDDIEQYYQHPRDSERQRMVWVDGARVPEQLQGDADSGMPDAGGTSKPGETDSGTPDGGSSSEPDESEDENEPKAPKEEDSALTQARSESDSCSMRNQKSGQRASWSLLCALGLVCLRRRLPSARARALD